MAAREMQFNLQNVYWHHELISRTPNDNEFVRDNRDNRNNDLHNAVLLSDVHACLRESHSSNIHDVNVKGETPLHLAAINTSQEGSRVIDILIEKGGDVNKQNKWGQTPLHYAAITDSFQNLEKLLALPNVDVNIADLNGYNALHCLISLGKEPRLDDFEDFDVAEFEEVRSDLIKAIHLLLDVGVRINCQTNFGHSVLHLASTRKDNTPLLRYIICSFPEVELRAKNQMGENFLHVYAASEIFEEISDTLDKIAAISLPVLKDLLSERNVFGRTPWSNMIDDANISEEALQKILSYGVSAKTADNLGNTVLHRIAGVSTGLMYSRIMDLLIQGGADIDAENVYRESPAFVLFLEKVFDVFTKYKMDFNQKDTWGRSPLVSIMKHRPIPSLLRKLIEEGAADVNTKDMYGSTPLHFVAYHNFPEQVELLLKYGADRDAVDDLQDRPLDTVRRHCSFLCHNMLEEDDMGTSEIPRNRAFEEILLNMPRMLPSSSITSARGVQTVLGLQGHMDGFSQHLMTRYYFRPMKIATEVEEVVSEVNTLVASLCGKIATYDSRFEMSVFPSGSSAEGTKVGRPDEFDFVLCLDKFNDKTAVVMTEECLETGYACLRFTETPVSKEYLPFCDADGYFLALPILQHFFRYLRRALNETELWTSGNLYYNFEDKMEVLHGKPVFNFCVYWMGSVYKQLKMSIDLVPAVYKRGWWPPNINTNEILLMNENVIDAGCFLMLQTKVQDFDKKRHLLNDSISHTCNILEGDENFVKRRMLRISATPAEIALMKTLPEKFRHAYALAKIVKTKEVCPEIEIDKLPTNRYYMLKKFNERKPLPVKPPSVIKSYMLKNCTFYLFQEMRRRSEQSYAQLNIAELAAKLYEQLLVFADEHSLKPYFLPFSDVFEFEKDEPKTAYTDFLLKLQRELSLKLALGILNHPFPEMCVASKIEGMPFVW